MVSTDVEGSSMLVKVENRGQNSEMFLMKQFQASFFPMPKNEEALSQPVKEWNRSNALQTSSENGEVTTKS